MDVGGRSGNAGSAALKQFDRKPAASEGHTPGERSSLAARWLWREEEA